MYFETPEKSGVIWTEAAKLREDGRTIKWDKINFPGRNVKSMQNIWTRINKQIADLDTQENNGEPTPVKTPRKKGQPKKKAPKATDFGAGAVDDDFDIKQELLKKRDLDDEEPTAAIKKAKVKSEANGNLRVKKENAKEY
ncbi:hypothetical protein TGAM01_v201758 [Trichoderma gamsii]|uniref:Uncharacterized protein n=1 Tax=Trichoderma gamsii TaxID=398673 RepID=A0A2P4ZYY5_9HYPO|nr:hypothetical protein TGAM01_v201758 [Trichoderma gamsii]PON29509.1 hypothetical protein TGAM01_v201758 [Trichoderma gamsii]